jgi:hypothetical protein
VSGSARLLGFDRHRLCANGGTLLETAAKKHFREASAVKPVIKTALEVADERINYRKENLCGPHELVDVLTRLRAAICLAEDAGLSTQALLEKELLVMLHG